MSDRSTVIEELRRIAAKQTNGMSDRDILSLVCAALADNSADIVDALVGIADIKKALAVQDERIKALEARDVKVLIGSVVAAISAGVVAWWSSK